MAEEKSYRSYLGRYTSMGNLPRAIKHRWTRLLQSQSDRDNDDTDIHVSDGDVNMGSSDFDDNYDNSGTSISPDEIVNETYRDMSAVFLHTAEDQEELSVMEDASNMDDFMCSDLFQNDELEDSLPNLELEDDMTDVSNIDGTQPIYDGATCTYQELAVLFVSLKTTFNLPTNALDFILKIFKMALPKGSGQALSIRQFYAFIQQTSIFMRKHYYCNLCNISLDSDDKCTNCGHDKIKYFIAMPIEEQLQRILQRNWPSLSYRFERSHTAGICDVYDGKLYKKHFGNLYVNKLCNNICSAMWCICNYLPTRTTQYPLE